MQVLMLALLYLSLLGAASVGVLLALEKILDNRDNYD
jgi:hypothetical protein